MNTNTIYNIAEQYRAAFELLDVDEDTGEILNPGALDIFENAGDNARDLAESAGLYIRELNAAVTAVATERKRLQLKEKALAKKTDRIKAALLTLIERIGKVKTPRVTVYTLNSKRVVVDDVEALPDAFVRIERRASAADIKQALAGGEAVPGAHIEHNSSVCIR